MSATKLYRSIGDESPLAAVFTADERTSPWHPGCQGCKAGLVLVEYSPFGVDSAVASPTAKLLCRSCGEIYTLHDRKPALRTGDDRNEQDVPVTIGWCKARLAKHREQIRELTATVAMLETSKAILHSALDQVTLEHAEAMGQVNTAAKVSEYAFDRGYWMAMRDVLRHLNAWEAAGLGQPIAGDDGRYDGFDDGVEMIRHQIGCFFDEAVAGWGDEFPTFEEWSA